MKQILSLTALGCLFLGSADAATPSIERDTALRLHLSAAVDSDCDGSLSDETPAHASFDTEKVMRAGQCLIYRTDYHNDGDFAIRQVELRTPLPDFMVYVDGSAEHVETPPGLWPVSPRPPVNGRHGDVVWPFKGDLAPGETGRVEFGVRLMPEDAKLDFVRKD